LNKFFSEFFLLTQNYFSGRPKTSGGEYLTGISNNWSE